MGTTSTFFTNMVSKFDRTFPYVLVWRPYPFPVGELLIDLLNVTVKSHFLSHISDNLFASEAKKKANVMFFETSLKKLHITLNIHNNKHLLSINKGDMATKHTKFKDNNTIAPSNRKLYNLLYSILEEFGNICMRQPSLKL
jgi:hypothetical protein